VQFRSRLIVVSTPNFKFFVALIAALTYASAAAAAPNVGDVAPDWSLPGSDGEQYSLSQLRGKHVVIAFFPKAFTSG
jgi:peroxiredoxin Q/BCP